MIKVFYGDDRVKAKQAIEKFLGADYEIIDCENLTALDLPSIFLGASLFAETRSILLREFTANKEIAENLEKYLNTPHRVALFETKLDKRGAIYKNLKDKLEFLEFALPKQDFRLVFKIYDTAKRDGKQAVKMLREIEQTEEPIMFLGALVSSALKDYAARPNGAKEKRALVELSKIDLQLKTASTQPWLLLESFLLRLSSL